MRAGAWLAAAALAACGAPPPPPRVVTVAPLVAVRVAFLPPLSAAATLVVEHESGYRWQGLTAATGVTFLAPAGPCSLTLRRGDGVVELACKVSAREPELEWRLPTR